MKRGFNVRGQITVFVIVGILIVAIAGGIGYSIKVNRDARLNAEFFAQTEIKSQVDNIQENVFNCMDEVSKDSLTVIGIQGGYYNPPAEYLDLGWGFIPYYYKEGAILMPSRDNIASELEAFNNEQLESCLNELSFEDFELSYDKLNTEVSIKDEAVLFDVEGDIKIIRENKRTALELRDYPISHPSALSDILEIAEYITITHKIDAKMYCITCVAEMAEIRDVYVQTTPLPDKTIYIIIGENRTADDPFLFGFLNKYTGDEVSDDFKLTGEGAEVPEDI